MGLIRTRRLFASGGLALMATFVLLVAVAAPSAQADERALDPVLSLIGGCAEPEALDPVPDPGCPEGSHPPAAFAVPMAVTTDFYGNIYVSNFGKKTDGTQGRIDVFDPEGVFISELKTQGPTSVAVDSEGNLYVVAEIESNKPILRFEPSVYKPEEGEIQYGNAPVALALPEINLKAVYTGLAINADNDHLFASTGGGFTGGGLFEFDSAANGNTELRNITMPTYPYGVGVAVDAARDLLYVAVEDERIDIFDLTDLVGTPPDEKYEKVGSIEGSILPEGNFGGFLSIAVDEGNGNIFVLDGNLNVLYQFAADGSYITTIEHGFQVPFGAEIGIDNGPFSPNGALSDNGRYLYVPSGKTGTGHSYAFEESESRAPVVKSTTTSGVTEVEAELQADVNPGNLVTTYTFEYTTEESFEAEGFNGATVAGSGQLAGNLDDEASAGITGLEAGTKYRFRIVATNEKGSDESEGSFSTYPTFETDSAPCANELLRIGFSAALPDCRAYELVTPADTNGRAPVGTGQEGGVFTTRQISPAGDKVPFRVEGGTLPESNGTGSYLGDPFVSSRGPDGWSTAYTGPTAAEAVAVKPGGVSPDVGYSFWTAENKGSALVEGKATTYLRYPDGHSVVLGEGTVGTDLAALGQMLSENGEHAIFVTGGEDKPAVQILPDAAPDGTQAIYDRTPEGVHTVSLLPGDVPLIAGQNAVFYGASLDGKGVAFVVSSKILYLRYDNSETYEIGENVKFAGIAEGGNRIFFMKEGRLWRFDALTGETVAFSAGTVVPVNISADGSTAYFVSTSKLSSESNPNGKFAKAGQQNLYLSEEGSIQFVGAVTTRDVEGEFGGTRQVDGLGLWVEAAGRDNPGRFGVDPSRSTPDGKVLLFQSRAPLAGYDPEGFSQVYRYDSVGETLACLSCNPTGAAAVADATLQSENREGFSLFLPHAWLRNLRPDGRRAIFQSKEPLVTGDSDGLQDVYEWEDQGVGSCASPGGCISLISSGHSARNDYLWAVSESGNDVHFITSDLLLPIDQDETPSIYDARVGGGFPEPAEAECQGEGCRPLLSSPPVMPAIQTPVQGEGDNVKPKRCGKGKHKVKRGGKVRCVKKKHKKHSSRRAGTKQGGGSK